MADDKHDDSGIQITGQSDYIEQVKKTLDLLKTYNEGYSIIKNSKYLGLIAEVDPPSGMRAYDNPPTFGMSRLVAFAHGNNDLSLLWCAGCIAHDTYHSKLYHDYASDHWWVPDSVWTSPKAERLCMAHQIDVICHIGNSAPNAKHLIQYLKTLDGTHGQNGPVPYTLQKPPCFIDTMPPNLLSI